MSPATQSRKPFELVIHLKLTSSQSHFNSAAFIFWIPLYVDVTRSTCFFFWKKYNSTYFLLTVVNKNRAFFLFSIFFLQVYVLYLWATMGFLCFTSPSPMYDVHCFSSVLSRHATTNSCFCIITTSYRNHPFQRRTSNLHTRMAPSSCSWIWYTILDQIISKKNSEYLSLQAILFDASSFSMLFLIWDSRRHLKKVG